MISVIHNSKLYAIIVPYADTHETNFITPHDLALQVGFISHNTGGRVNRHKHKDIHRHLLGTSEVLFVLYGSCIVTLYEGELLIKQHTLSARDVIIINHGGHSFEFLEPTKLLEVKQGPYYGTDEKVIY